MILPYLARLTCLSLACFFLVQLLVGSAVSWLAPFALAIARRASARFAAGFLFAIRMLPAAAGILAVALLCVPSYLWLEADAGGERVGAVCLGAALLGLAAWIIALVRGLRAIRRSLEYERRCRLGGCELLLAGETVWIVDSAGGLLALAGVAPARLFVSRAVLENLSAEQLEVALGHERAHRISRDNLRRLLLLLTPDLLPGALRFLGGLRAIELGWARFAEWAADDLAVAGDPRRRASLAAALVRVARLGCAAQSTLLVTSLVSDGRDLEARVERLLETSPAGRDSRSHGAIFGVVTILCAVFAALVAIHAATLQAAHQLFEYLLR